MTSSVIVTIVVILGIIIAGGFLLYFMGDLLMSLSNKNKDKDAVQNKQAQEQKALEERVAALENSEKAKNDPQIATILFNGGVVENYNPEEENAEETPAEETTEEAPVEESVEEAPVEETTEEDDEASEYIRQRRLELMERLAKLQQETEETTEEVAEEATEEAPVEEAAEETPAEETTEEVAEEATEEVAEEVAEEVPADETAVNTLAATSTLEELEAKLADEQEKLKANEKELRQCKKDYLPLRKVKRTLENDEKKLRRKEALVAKQKVVLYGVNNYADIDEEKAKKLAEDLDLLDGLKLSVQHCEEVIEKNEERYPLLEKIYNLLTAQNEEIKANINDLKEAIEVLKADETPADDTNTDAE